jgi:hypothetical protein
VLLRDRNHPSLVIVGLLNETFEGPVFRHVVTRLPMIREIDPARLVLLNSGRMDVAREIGSYCNPGSIVWEGKMADLIDTHTYTAAPLRQFEIDFLRAGKGERYPPGNNSFPGPIFLSEYGFCGTMDLPSELSQFKRLGQEQSDDARYFRKMMDRFMTHWTRWRLDEIWKLPEEYFAAGHRNYARLKKTAETAMRSNPSLLSYSQTHLAADAAYAGCGLTTFFREPKDPSLFEGARLLNAPLRWCLFATPNNVYRGTSVRFEAVLADEDTLQPGEYPVHVEILGPDGRKVATRDLRFKVEAPAQGRERAFALPCFDEKIPVDGPAGAYECVVTMADRKEIPGGRLTFHVDDPGAMPAMPTSVTFWGDDKQLTDWLTNHGVKILPFDPLADRRQTIIVGAKPPTTGGQEAFAGLFRHLARGSTAVFLNTSVFSNPENDPWLPLKRKEFVVSDWCCAYYRADIWNKRHEIFQGLPTGGMMDYDFYGPLISGRVIVDQGENTKNFPRLGEAVCGATRTSSSDDWGAEPGLYVSVYELGAGRFVLNTLDVEPNLDQHPAAERLLRNMLNYAARDIAKPLAELPADFDGQLKTMLPPPPPKEVNKVPLLINKVSSPAEKLPGWGKWVTPFVLANGGSEAATLLGVITFPPGSILVHPGSDRDVAIGWLSPIAGNVKVRAKVTKAHIGHGDGVSWKIIHSSQAEKKVLVAGEIENDGSQEIPLAADASKLADVTMQKDDLLYLQIGRRGGHGGDSTVVELVIAEVGGSGRVWNLAKDVAADIQAGNPHADSLGNAAVWYFLTPESD